MYKVYLPKGVLHFPDGERVELYSIGVIADILAREWRTIRDWEIRGLIPLSPFCDKFGRRLYTKDMIRCISQCAEEYKIPLRSTKPLKYWGFFQQLPIRLERLYTLYKARLELEMPESYREWNKRYIRSIVLQSEYYKNYLIKKEEIKNAANRKRSERMREYRKTHPYTQRQLNFFAACKARKERQSRGTE